MAKEERIRIAVIDPNKCSPEKCGFLCVRVCPINRSGKQCIAIAESMPTISETLCTGCGICVNKCPFKAISIVNLTARLVDMVHCYGKNRFRLYGLPIPSKGNVVGLIGRNGIGKSTALKILSGKLLPRPDCEGEAGYAKLIEIFKGKELQAYFEKLSNKGMKVSFKPQEISKIQEFDGTVEAMLKAFDEQKKLHEVVEMLGLKKILKNKLSELSGGELQKVAIAASMLKDAEFYFFDEPSSYLDVQERLLVAKAIRAIAEQGKYVMVVEHDLAVLDYLSDFIHVIFGSKSVYGVVSSRMSVLNGINQYLSGYLKAENVCFRDKELSFSKISTSAKKARPYISYPAFRKSYKAFSLETEGGTIMDSEVMGILGPNAIGKTTFANVIAGISEHDSGRLDLGLKLSYKPQYIKADSDETVLEFIQKSMLNMEIFESEANKKLHINELYEYKMDELSGGELQKVLVAATMCKEAALYILDEPSAFLDIEERLSMASFIRSVIEKSGKACLVVDHDLLFQDYLCDRFIVFEGVPARYGKALAPQEKENAMNRFLKVLDITFRRDPQTGRPRANKPGSVKDQEQKKEGKYYYL